MAVIIDGSTIVLSGTVGDLFWEDCFSAAEVSLALAQVGHAAPVTIRVNSGGGIAVEGSAIHAAIARHAGRKTIVIEGVAASAASLLVMAGDEIVMAPGAVMMIHDPANVTWGTAADHEQRVRELNAIATSMAGIYGERSGDTLEQVRADMVAELWMTPEEAVSRGYADRVGTAAAANEGGAEIIDFPEREPAAFAYAHYRNAPERLRALAVAKGWTPSPSSRQTASAVVPNRQESTMTNTPGGVASPSQATTTQPTPETNVVDLTAARSSARAEALAYARSVNELCQLAGLPDKATAFIEADTPLDDVRKALLDAQATAQTTATASLTTQPAPQKPRFSLASNMRSRFGIKEN